MRRIVCLAVLLSAAFAAPAAAQPRDWSIRPLGDRGVPGADSATWDRCAHSERVYEPAVSIEACDRLIARSNSPSARAVLYWQRALRHLQAGHTPEYQADLEHSQALWTQDIAANPRDFSGYSNRGTVLVQREQFDAALADYERAIELERQAASPHLGRGGVLFRRGDYQGAMEAFDQASRVAARTNASTPRHAAARCEARAALRTDLQQALSLCNRAVRNADTPSGALASRGYLHFMSDDLASAAADFARAVEANPYSAVALYGRGVVALRQGDPSGQADIDRAREMDRLDVDYYANAGLAP